MTWFSAWGPSPWSQRRRDRVQPVIVPDKPLEPAVTVDLARQATWLTEDDVSDPDYLAKLINVATERANRFTRFEHAERVIECRWDFLPTDLDHFGGMQPLGAAYSEWIDLPVYPVQSIDSVEIAWRDGTTTAIQAYDEDLRSKPARVKINPKPITWNRDLAHLRITVTAGPHDTDPVDAYELAVAQLAAYMYDHRACGAEKAMQESGAADMLRPYMLRRGL